MHPTALLETGGVHAVMHHGGNNFYHEAVAAGVPQVVLHVAGPVWLRGAGGGDGNRDVDVYGCEPGVGGGMFERELD